MTKRQAREPQRRFYYIQSDGTVIPLGSKLEIEKGRVVSDKLPEPLELLDDAPYLRDFTSREMHLLIDNRPHLIMVSETDTTKVKQGMEGEAVYEFKLVEKYTYMEEQRRRDL